MVSTANELLSAAENSSRLGRLQHAFAKRVISTRALTPDPYGWSSGRPRRWLYYCESFALIALITGIGLRIEQRMAPTNVAMLYLLAVVVSALRCGRGPALFSAVLGALAFDFFLIPTYRSFAVTDIWYMITFLTLLVVGLLVSTLAGEAREQAEQARRNEAYTAAMYSFGQSLESASHLDEIVNVVGRHVFETFHWPVVVALPGEAGLTARFRSPEFPYGPAEQAAAAWALEHGQTSGCRTTNLPSAEGHYLPLKTAWGIQGVVGVRVSSAAMSAARQYPLLESFASRAALALGRAVSEQKAREAERLEETDRLQKALLNSISHNFRTPLATVTGALKSLIDDTAVLDEPTRQELLINAEEQATRLDQLVGNLLDMTRLQAGAVHVKRRLCDIRDTVETALDQLGQNARNRQIRLDLPAEPLLIPLDFVLVTQVVFNLIDNALKYSAAGTPVDIQVRQSNGCLEVTVSDHGAGIAPQDLERVFERFQRGSRNGQPGGTGLGLSICKGFVEAHGGRIWAERRAEGGTRVSFTIPTRDKPQTSMGPDS